MQNPGPCPFGGRALGTLQSTTMKAHINHARATDREARYREHLLIERIRQQRYPADECPSAVRRATKQ